MSFEQGRIIHRSANHPDFDPKPEGDDGEGRIVYHAPPRAPLGLGDLAYKVFHPIGCGIDRLTKLGAKRWHTKLCGCLACSARRRRWNVWLPDVRRWGGGWQVACKAIAGAMKRAFSRR